MTWWSLKSSTSLPFSLLYSPPSVCEWEWISTWGFGPFLPIAWFHPYRHVHVNFYFGVIVQRDPTRVFSLRACNCDESVWASGLKMRFGSEVENEGEAGNGFFCILLAWGCGGGGLILDCDRTSSPILKLVHRIKSIQAYCRCYRRYKSVNHCRGDHPVRGSKASSVAEEIVWEYLHY